MEILETKLINVKDIVVGRCITRPIEEMKDNEDLKNLSDSMDEVGQLHPCLVRIIDSKYELIAGGRRYVALSQKENNIEVKIVEASDLEAMELGITENLHRKDPDLKQRDHQIYRVWKFGKTLGQYKHVRDISKKIALSERKLGEIIFAGETKEKKEYKDSSIINRATTTELVVTKQLSDFPNIREKIIGIEQKKDITIKDMGDISKKIIITIEKGVDEDIVSKAIDLVTPSENVSVEDVKKSLAKSSSEESSTPVVVFQPKMFTKILNTLEESPKDIQKKIVYKKISLENAKKLNQFETIEQRDQVFKEISVIEKHKEISAMIHDNDIKTNVELRKKQADDIKKEGDTKIKTPSDLRHQRKLELEQTYDQRHEKAFLERYQKLALDTNIVFSTFHPRKLKTEQGKKDVINVIKSIYALYRLLLEEVGEIHKVENMGTSKKQKDIEMLRIT